MPIHYFLVVIGLAFTVFLTSSFQNYRDFQQVTQVYSSWDTMMLAAATHSGKISSDFLLQLQQSLAASLSSLKYDNYGLRTADTQINLERFKLIENYPYQFKDSSLFDTITLGLNPSQLNGLQLKDQYQSFELSLYNSEFLEPQLSHQDPLLRSTLLTKEQLGSVVELESFYQRFVIDSKLQINPNLLEALLNSDAYETIQVNQKIFAVNIVDSGLNFDDLVNVIAITIQAKSANDKDKKLYQIERYATAQLRLLPINKPSSSSITLNLFTVPVKSRKFVYDANKPISAANPVRIVSRIKGGYNSFYFGEDGHLNIGIGAIATKHNNLKPLADQKKYFNSSFFTNEAVLTNDDADDNVDKEVGLDIFPRGRTRYTTTDQSFKVREFTIPPGFIVVGIRKAGELAARPDLNEFGEFRIYNPETGFLVSTFKYADMKTASCAKAPCVDFTKFYTSKKTSELGARLYSKFSTKDLFPGLVASKAIDLWLNLQIDLSLDTIFDISSPTALWQERIFKSLSKQDKIYLSHIIDYSDSAQINSVFHFTDIAFEKMNEQMKNYYLAEVDALKTYVTKKISGAKAAELKMAKKHFDIAKKNFDDYVRLKK